MDKAHALALLKDTQSTIDRHRNDLKRCQQDLLLIESGMKILKQFVEQVQEISIANE
jgi:hypothetical protein